VIMRESHAQSQTLGVSSTQASIGDPIRGGTVRA
jgi:hypothetical protein